MTNELPAAVQPLRGGAVLRWAVLAPGVIAADFVATLHENSDQRVVAVGSRSKPRAEEFAARFGVANAYGSYEETVADPAVDVVYIASPNSEHASQALLAIAAGKHVLVEKPLAVNAAQARQIAQAAKDAGVFAMEAMWSRYLPHIQRAAEIISSGQIGEVRLATADVGWRVDPSDTGHKLLDPALGGGTMLDASIYGFWLTQFALGPARRVRAVGSMTPSGVDEQFVAALEMAPGVHASVSSSLAVTNSGFASIRGTAGSIGFDGIFLFPSPLLVQLGTETQVWTDPSGLTGRGGLVWQAVAVAQHIADGLLESPVHPMADSIALATTMDEVRAQITAP